MGNFDKLIFEFIFKLRELNFPLLEGLGIFLATYLPYFLIISFIFLISKEKSNLKRLFLFFEGTIAVILSRGILVEFIRFFYYRPRPFEALSVSSLIGDNLSSSFPSGHAAFFFALALIVFSINRQWGWWYFILAALNGLSRIFVGVHWPFDILGGALVGIISGQLTIALLAKTREKISLNPKISAAHLTDSN